MPTAIPISRITLDIESLTGIRCDTSADRPIAAATDDSASSTGTPAASSAPNARTRIASEIGTESFSARSKS
jgi:hypothetical protein